MKKFVLFIVLLIATNHATSQIYSSINGVVKDKNTQEQLPGVKIRLIGLDTIMAISDIDGKFNITAPVGKYNLEASFYGFSNYYSYNLNLNSGNGLEIAIELEEEVNTLNEVVVREEVTARAADMTTPMATQKLTAEEIKVNPGGNFDVSKVIQVLPGVAGGTSPNRNDIIVRGGGPSENVYYLDGVEIPVLNHFQTQGASGGATGLLNVSFIQDVQLSSSAFDSRYDNALASTIVIKQRNGNDKKFSGNTRLSGSEFAVMLEGPISKKATFMVSARRSYLQFLFQLLDLPIRPDYWDFQYKVNYKINSKTELNLIGLGAIDNFKLVSPKDSDAENEYIMRANPLIKQWNYTMGASLKRLVKNGYINFILSRNMFFNGANRYENNALKSGDLLFSLGSHEAENKLRINVNKFTNGWKYSYGIDAQYVKYDSKLSNIIQQEELDTNGNIVAPEIKIQTNSAIGFFKFGGFGQVSKYFFDNKFLVASGLRFDMNTFTNEGLNPLKTLSPRISFSYLLSNKWNISASVGNYYKIPSYTSLGYSDASGTLQNRDLKYIQSIHYTLGTQFIPKNDLRFTFEVYYKDYRQYPVSTATGISFANVGTDFSAVGNEEFQSTGKGRVYGLEFFVQQKLVKNLFYVASVSLYKSEFSGTDGQFRPSTWDYGFLFSTTIGYKFKKNWDIGIKYRLSGGQPYTPFDLNASTANYLTTGTGVLDYTQINAERLPIFQQLDLRVDKKFNFKKVSLTLFLDFQNVFLYKTPSTPRFTFERNEDNTGFQTTDGQTIKPDGSNAIPVVLMQRSATLVPSLGFIFEF
ncbi:MAG: TonB-dependent receptor [Bacteroidota bacterium]